MSREARVAAGIAVGLAWLLAAQFVNGLALLAIAGLVWLLAGVEIAELPDGIAELEAYANEKGKQ